MRKVLKVLGRDKHGPTNPHEVAIQACLKHPYLIPFDVLIGTGCGLGGLGIVMPLAEATLLSVVHSTSLTLERRLTYSLQVLQGLSFMHDNHYLHLDIKADNVLLQGGVARLADFGFSVKVRDIREGIITTSKLVTPLYRPPELLRTPGPWYNYNAQTESWTLAHFLLRVIVGDSIFEPGAFSQQRVGMAFVLNDFERQRETIVRRLCQGNFRYSGPSTQGRPTIGDTLEVLLNGLFSYNPRSRPTVRDLIGSSIFDSVRSNVQTGVGELAPRCLLLPPEGVGSQVASLCEMLRSTWPRAGVKLLFVAVDLFLRSVVYTTYMELEPERMAAMWRAVAASGTWVAFKMCYGYQETAYESILRWSGSTSSHLDEIEIGTIVGLAGNLCPDFLYEACEGRNHYEMSYVNVVRGDPRIYVDVDVGAWVRAMGPGDGNYNMTIADLPSDLPPR